MHTRDGDGWSEFFGERVVAVSTHLASRKSKKSQASPSRLLPDCPSSRRMAPLPFFFRSPCRRIVVTARLGSRSHLCVLVEIRFPSLSVGPINPVLESSSFRVSEGEHGDASALSACGTAQRELYSFVIVMARFDLSAPPSLGLHLQAGFEAVGNERSCRYIHSGTCIWQLQYRHLHTFQACRAPQRWSLRPRCRVLSSLLPASVSLSGVFDVRHRVPRQRSIATVRCI